MRKMSNLDFTEKVINSKQIFDGNIFSVKVDQVELPDGSGSFREIVNHNGGACVVALDDNNYLYFVEQYRISVQETTLEIPAGKIDQSEDHLTCAQRELKEEIGITAKDWQLLTSFYPTPGYCSEIVNIYLAQNLTVGEPELDQGEFLRVKKLKLDQALDMIVRNQIKDSKTIIGILLTVQVLQEKTYGR